MSASTRIEIRDERGEQGPAAWIGSIGCQLERFKQDRLPFAVLLIELLEVERLLRGEPPAELTRLADQVEDALAAELRSFAGDASRRGSRSDVLDVRRSGLLTRQSPGRYWLLAPDTDRPSARRLAERLARAVASAVTYRGAPLEVVVGVAVCPEDGLQAPALAAQADMGLYAAHSAVRSSLPGPPAPPDTPA